MKKWFEVLMFIRGMKKDGLKGLVSFEKGWECRVWVVWKELSLMNEV